MIWIDNYKEYKLTGRTGKCPKCGSTDVTVKELAEVRRSVSFFCPKCKAFSHIDEAKILHEGN